MLNLIRYDWMRRWKFFAAGLIVFLLVNIDLLYRTISKSNPSTITAIFILVLFVLSVGLFFDHVGRMYRSLFKEEGQLLFSLPINGYHFLGGKMLAVIIECIAVMLFVGVALYMDYIIIEHFSPDVFAGLIIHTNVSFVDLWQGIKILGIMLLSYIGFLLMVNLSMVLVKSIFSSNRYGILLSFVFFLVLSKVIDVFGNAFSLITNYPLHTSNAGAGALIIGIFIMIMFFATGYLLDRRINL
ncbi:MAG: hypothetical protein AAGU27_22945 [Dehalobacterium sp.]